jgi:RHS repeat-associated protein
LVLVEAVIRKMSDKSAGGIKYYPYGICRNSTGDLATDKLFTGQRLDDTGLYYYGSRYYYPTIGRFISPDTIVPNPMNPQAFNRYAYALNNPLRYIDPTGHRMMIAPPPPPRIIIDPGPPTTPPSPEPSPTPSLPIAPTQQVIPTEHGPAKPPDTIEHKPNVFEMAYETYEIFGYQAIGFLGCGVITTAGLAFVALGAATSELVVGIPVIVVGAAVTTAGFYGMGLMGYTMIETWQRLDFSNRWKQALGFD